MGAVGCGVSCAFIHWHLPDRGSSFTPFRRDVTSVVLRYTYGVAIIVPMMCSVRRARVFSTARRLLLSGGGRSCQLEVGELEVRGVELREVMRVREWVSHERLLERRIVAAAAAHVRLEVAPSQLIHTQRIVDVAGVGADGSAHRIAMNGREFVVEERVQSVLLLLLQQVMVVERLVHGLALDLHVVSLLLLLLLLLLFLDLVLRKHSIR